MKEAPRRQKGRPASWRTPSRRPVALLFSPRRRQQPSVPDLAFGKEPAHVQPIAVRYRSGPRCHLQPGRRRRARSAAGEQAPIASPAMSDLAGPDPTTRASCRELVGDRRVRVSHRSRPSRARGRVLFLSSLLARRTAPCTALGFVACPRRNRKRTAGFPRGLRRLGEHDLARIVDEVWRHVGRHCRAHPAGRAPREARGRRRQPGVGGGLGHVGQDQRAGRLGQRSLASCTMRANMTPSSPRASRSPPA